MIVAVLSLLPNGLTVGVEEATVNRVAMPDVREYDTCIPKRGRWTWT